MDNQGDPEQHNPEFEVFLRQVESNAVDMFHKTFPWLSRDEAGTLSTLIASDMLLFHQYLTISQLQLPLEPFLSTMRVTTMLGDNQVLLRQHNPMLQRPALIAYLPYRYQVRHRRCHCLGYPTIVSIPVASKSLLKT